MKIKICCTTNVAKNLYVPLFLHKRLKTMNEGVPDYQYVLFSHESKENVRKISGR